MEVADLASGAAVSRSLLAERFRHVLGRSPIHYLTEWRTHLAQDLLATTDASVAAVAPRVGYDSEEAFSRAFKRAHGLSPSTGARRVPPRDARQPLLSGGDVAPCEHDDAGGDGNGEVGAADDERSAERQRGRASRGDRFVDAAGEPRLAGFPRRTDDRLDG